MEKIFLNILDMSVVGSYIILVVLFVRILLKKLPKIFSYVLWSVVFFRLLCPFTLESSVSLLPEETQGISFTRFSEDSSSSQQQLPPENTVIPEKEPIIQVVDEAKVENTPMIQREEPQKESLSLLQGSQILWICGMFVIATYSLLSLLKLKNTLKLAFHFEQNIYFADNIDGPFVFGLWKPKIYVPTYLDDDELSHIIAHEQEHIRRFDHVTRLLCHLAVIVHWFNPFVWLAYHASAKDMELSCDEGVLKEKSMRIRGEYARTLLKFSGDGSFVTPLAFSENNTKGRVKNIMKMKKSKLWVSGLAGVLVLGLVVGFSTSQKPKEIVGVLPEQLEHNMLLYYTKIDGVEETQVYRLWDNEGAQKELSQLLANQAYHILELEEDPEILQEMATADREQIMLWGDYGDATSGIMSFDLSWGEASVAIGNSLDYMHGGMGEMENQETLLQDVFQLFEDKKESLHQVEKIPETSMGETATLVATLNGLTYEVGEEFYPIHPMAQAVGGSYLEIITDETHGSLSVRVSENPVFMPEENIPEKHYLIQVYEEVSSRLVVNQYGTEFVSVYFDETGFFTEPCYLPFTSTNGDEYLYQIRAEEVINPEEEETLFYLDGTFYFQDYEIYFGYTVPFPLENVMDWAKILLEMGNSFEIDSDGFHTRDYIWSDYEYITK